MGLCEARGVKGLGQCREMGRCGQLLQKLREEWTTAGVNGFQTKEKPGWNGPRWGDKPHQAENPGDGEATMPFSFPWTAQLFPRPRGAPE